MSRLSQFVRGVLKLDPQAPALEFQHRWRTWGDLDRVVTALDEALVAAGLAEGARIACLVRNHPLTAAAILSVVTSDRCVVTLNPALPDEKLAADIVSLAPPAIVGLEQDWARPAVRAAARQLGCLGFVLSEGAEAPVRAVEGLGVLTGAGLRRDATGVAIEMLTSGTTGAPKRIPLRVTALEGGLIAAMAAEGRQPDEPPRLRAGVQLLTAPFAHIGGIFSLFNSVTAGRSACLLERFNVEGFADAVRRHRPKVVGAPPTALRMILDAKVPKEDIASLVAFRTAAAPLDPRLAAEFQDVYEIPVLQNYGATEFAGGVAGWTLKDFKAHHAEKPGAVGRMNAGVEGRIVDPETGRPLPFGSEGLLELKAAHLSDGVSWTRTTDLAVLDAEGFLWIKGRYDNAIIRGGFKVQPDDIVRALEAHPAIREAAVVGLDDPRLGQTPAAAYIVRSGAAAPTEPELRDFLRERLVNYQIPARLMQVDELPRTPSLKVSQPDLRALFTARST